MNECEWVDVYIISARNVQNLQTNIRKEIDQIIANSSDYTPEQFKLEIIKRKEAIIRLEDLLDVNKRGSEF